MKFVTLAANYTLLLLLLCNTQCNTIKIRIQLKTKKKGTMKGRGEQVKYALQCVGEYNLIIRYIAYGIH